MSAICYFPGACSVAYCVARKQAPRAVGTAEIAYEAVPESVAGAGNDIVGRQRKFHIDPLFVHDFVFELPFCPARIPYEKSDAAFGGIALVDIFFGSFEVSSDIEPVCVAPCFGYNVLSESVYEIEPVLSERTTAENGNLD